jgi:photosystem II stability/assembly factor-like uncharacterized protein
MFTLLKITMKRKALLFVLVAFTCLNVSVLKAQWEPTSFTQSSVWVLCQTENGNLIAANDVYPDMGGIYLSDDAGNEWEKCDVADYSYTSHVVQGAHVYLGGVDCNVAISLDNGQTWTTRSFKELMPGVSPDYSMYAMEIHNGRIYAAVLTFGIAYSDDNGVNWSLTDRESLLDPNDPDAGGQWCYNLRSYNDKLYNIGAYGIYEYDEATDLWAKVDDQPYGASSVVVNDVMYVAYNASGLPSGIRYTTDFQTWEVMPIPDGASTSIRFLDYYNGAFIMGHVEEAILYTMDHGETWIEYRENFPKFSPVPGLDIYGTPMGVVVKDDKIFCGVFSPFDEAKGVCVAPLPEELLTAINQYADLAQPVLYPNPAQDLVWLQLPSGTKMQGLVQIMDVTGKIKHKQTILSDGSNKISISTSNWASGVYFYTLKTDDHVSSGKFIVE